MNPDISKEKRDLNSRQFSPNTEPLWTVDDVARYLRLEPETVRAMARRGDIPAVKIGRVWRFRRNLIKEITS